MHYFVKLGPSSFRSLLVKWSPSENLRRAQKIIDIMDETSKQIYEGKKAALARGDEAVLKQVGQGNDIMSVLSKHTSVICNCFGSDSRMTCQ